MRRIMMALAAAGVIVVGLAGSAAQAHDYRWNSYGWQRHEWREQAWRRYERDRHDERMAAIIGGSVSRLMWTLSHH
jgi:hypothetical protein